VPQLGHRELFLRVLGFRPGGGLVHRPVAPEPAGRVDAGAARPAGAVSCAPLLDREPRSGRRPRGPAGRR
jgi:hypothetical protein